PSRSLKFHTVASSLALHSVARLGTRSVPPGTKSTRRSVIWALTTSELPSCESTESSEDGYPLTPITRVCALTKPRNARARRAVISFFMTPPGWFASLLQGRGPTNALRCEDYHKRSAMPTGTRV